MSFKLNTFLNTVLAGLFLGSSVVFAHDLNHNGRTVLFCSHVLEELHQSQRTTYEVVDESPAGRGLRFYMTTDDVIINPVEQEFLATLAKIDDKISEIKYYDPTTHAFAGFLRVHQHHSFFHHNKVTYTVNNHNAHGHKKGLTMECEFHL